MKGSGVKIKPSDIKIKSVEDARNFLNEIFVGVASKYNYRKPSDRSMGVIVYTIKKGDIIALGSATLRELYGGGGNEISYELEGVVLHHEIKMPTNIEEILTSIRLLITPIFEAVATESIEEEMKGYIKAAKPKIEW